MLSWRTSRSSERRESRVTSGDQDGYMTFSDGLAGTRNKGAMGLLACGRW